MKISEIITDKYKLRIPPTVYYELLADVQEVEEYQEPTAQERQVESDKFDAAFQDGYNNGYAQARFDYEQEPTTKNDLAQERYQDLIEYFGDEKVAKTILESKKEFKAWLERLRWNVERVDELDRELEQIKETTKNNLGVDWENYKDADGNCLDDLILEVLQNNFDCGNTYGYKVADEIIELLPSVTPQEPRWIPVNEKLPNDRDWYLGIFKEPDTGWINPLPFICDYVGRETKATTKEFWILRGFTDRDYKECDYYYNLECVAWMPLPLPWKGE